MIVLRNPVILRNCPEPFKHFPFEFSVQTRTGAIILPPRPAGATLVEYEKL